MNAPSNRIRNILDSIARSNTSPPADRTSPILFHHWMNRIARHPEDDAELNLLGWPFQKTLVSLVRFPVRCLRSTSDY